MSPDKNQLARLSESVQEIPDKLFALQLDLLPLCRDDSPGDRENDKAKIAQACAQLHSLIGELAHIVEQIDETTADDGGALKVPLPATTERKRTSHPEGGAGDD
jgi:hypothetical protein